MTYQEQLKHPKWQKKRLEIMQHYGFKCRKCGDTETSLHIHHKTYKKGSKPWGYDNDNFECLCANCHIGEHDGKCCNAKLFQMIYDKEEHRNILVPVSPLYCPTCGTPIPEH